MKHQSKFKLECLSSKGFAEMVESSRSLPDLEERLKRFSGEKFDSLESFLEFIKIKWEGGQDYRITSAHELQHLPSYRGESGLPTFKTSVDGVDYELHGIVHGTNGFLTSGLRVRKNVKGDIGEIVRGFHIPSSGESYLCEQGIANIFGLSKTQEVKDHFLGKGDSITYKTILKSLAKNPLKILTLPVSLPLIMGLISLASWMNMKLIERKMSQGIRGLNEHILGALRSMEGQNQCFEYIIGGEMPQPIEFEREYVKKLILKEEDKIGIGHLLGGSYSKRIASAVERSLWAANELRRFAENNGIKNCTIYVGQNMSVKFLTFCRIQIILLKS